MRTLVIDTATKVCSVALFDASELLASRHEVIGRGHAERLLPLISDLPAKGMAGQIMVDVGPGSFTGIRVGLAAARALGFAWQATVGGYNCLQLIAAMAQNASVEQTAIDVVMTGGHGEYFHQPFGADGLPLRPFASVPADHIGERIMSHCIAGDIEMSRHIELLPDASHWHHIANVPALAPSPVYGRAPDAKPLQSSTA